MRDTLAVLCSACVRETVNNIRAILVHIVSVDAVLRVIVVFVLVLLTLNAGNRVINSLKVCVIYSVSA